MGDRYVIYARKSSDEKDRQIKSIPDQLEHCREVARRNGIVVAKGDEFQESRSAKTAGNRPVFDSVIELVKKGEVQGIISWHPDRLARNGPEGGMITGLLDEKKLADLKFCTFSFENNTAGKMMLGIMFVMSKEYSDRLSDNIRRGVDSNFAQGKSVGTYKWGYERNKEGCYEPHPQLFGYLKKAWQMRLDGKTYNEILEWLRIAGCHRRTKTGKTYGIGQDTLTQIFNDPIYYGVLRQKDSMVDLRELYDFEPMVSYEEWEKCRKAGRSAVKIKGRHTDPFRGGIVRCACGQPCVTDRGKKKYLYLHCKDRGNCRLKQPRIRAKEIVDAAYEALNNAFNPDDGQSDVLRVAYADHIKRYLNAGYEEAKKQKRKLVSAKNSAEEKLREIVLASVGKSLDETERRVYEQEKLHYERIIDKCRTDIERIEKSSVLKSFDYDEFSNFLESASASWKRAHGEPLHQMATFLFSNFTVKDRTVVNLRFNPDIEELFIPKVGDGGAEEIRTPDPRVANAVL